MALFYKNGFYDDAFGPVPVDAVPITQAARDALIAGQAAGGEIVTLPDGTPSVRPSQLHTWSGSAWVQTIVLSLVPVSVEKQRLVPKIRQTTINGTQAWQVIRPALYAINGTAEEDWGDTTTIYRDAAHAAATPGSTLFHAAVAQLITDATARNSYLDQIFTAAKT